MDERKLLGLAAGWELRAISLGECGAGLAAGCLRECAEELKAAVEGRKPVRTSWYEHEKTETTP